MPTMWTERLCSVKGRPFQLQWLEVERVWKKSAPVKAEAVTEGFHSPLLQLVKLLHCSGPVVKLGYVEGYSANWEASREPRQANRDQRTCHP